MAKSYTKFRTSVPAPELQPVLVTVEEVGSHGVVLKFNGITVATFGTAGDLRFASFRLGSSGERQLRELGVSLIPCSLDPRLLRIESLEYV